MCRKLKIAIVCLLLLGLSAGCGSEYVAGAAGAGGGFALSETFKGAKVDLDRREAALVEAYNVGVEQGAEAETLEEIKREIADTRSIREGVETGETLLSIDWNNPKEVGGGIGVLVSSILLILKRRQLNNVMAGVHKFEGTHDAKTAAELHSAIVGKSVKLPS